jgi:peptidoglycan/xylan/chitin deacetylase (PgdA/CDA1 family)
MKRSTKKKFSWPEGQRAALSISWDDARPSAVEVGVPIFDEHGIKATFYVLPRNMTKQVKLWRAAAANGHEMGNHTIKHPCMGNFVGWQTPETMLENYTLQRMEKEILQANDVIQTMLGVCPTSFAYPCAQTYVGRGRTLKSYVPVVAKHFVVGRAGFSEMFASPERCDLAQVPSLDSDHKSFDELKGLLDSALAKGGWLIITGHEVGDGRVHQTASASGLDKLCRYLRKHPEVWVDTVSAIGRHIGSEVKHPSTPEARFR